MFDAEATHYVVTGLGVRRAKLTDRRTADGRVYVQQRMTARDRWGSSKPIAPELLFKELAPAMELYHQARQRSRGTSESLIDAAANIARLQLQLAGAAKVRELVQGGFLQ